MTHSVDCCINTQQMKFGPTVRALREKRQIGLRRLATLIGVSPTYLSRIERDLFPPPSEEKILAIADALDQNPDELLALAGRVASDIPEIIRRRPREFAGLLRTSQDATRRQLDESIAGFKYVCDIGKCYPEGRDADALRRLKATLAKVPPLQPTPHLHIAVYHTELPDGVRAQCFSSDEPSPRLFIILVRPGLEWQKDVRDEILAHVLPPIRRSGLKVRHN